MFFVFKLLIYLLAIVSCTFVLPVVCGLYYHETDVFSAFIIPFVAIFVLSAIMFFCGKKRSFNLSSRQGYIMVAIAWLAVSFFGAIPFVLSGYIPSMTDAFFESVSGFTTTGATILSEVEKLPHALNLWRTQMHWLGGMGIIVLTVALMPLLGVGGFQLIKAETTGPEKEKITPKIAVTAKMLWYIYTGMTVLQTVLLMFAGMNFFDALAHTFASLGTGGFSTRNASVGAYNSPAIDWICTIFMILAGVNFTLYYQLMTGKGHEVFKNTELKVYLSILAASILIVAVIILPIYGSVPEAFRYSAFQVSTIMSTTGFATADYTTWPAAAQMIIFLLMIIGSCSGSTCGGIKVVRWVVMAKQATNEMRRLLHPHGIFSIRLNGRAGRKDIVFNVASFIFLYTLLVILTTFVATFGGADLFSAFTASLALVGNIGPGFGMVGPVENYGFFAPLAKWWFSFAMLAGRLELYTMFFFFCPAFWKK